MVDSFVRYLLSTWGWVRYIREVLETGGMRDAFKNDRHSISNSAVINNKEIPLQVSK
jgi:hypothetical protein